jgi:hypothetical protein
VECFPQRCIRQLGAPKRILSDPNFCRFAHLISSRTPNTVFSSLQPQDVLLCSASPELMIASSSECSMPIREHELQRCLRANTLAAKPFEPRSIVRMWDQGPLRQFARAEKRPASNYVPYQTANLTGFAGSYVCDVCRCPSTGIYRVLSLGKWVCGGCKKAVRTTQRALQNRTWEA